MKYALIIGNNQYDDPKLAQLKTPAADTQALASVLDDRAIGSFDEVTPLLNPIESRARRTISTFLAAKKSDDLVLLYFSGHGVLDDRGRLHLAFQDTQFDLLTATSLPASFIADEMDNCRSKRQILILDCCHSGAFARGTKGDQKAITETTFEGSGFGRVVLTASDSTQYALEGDQVIKQSELSLFTHFLLQALKTGEADMNNDGLVSLDEWYDYTYAKVISETPRQVPHKWSYNQQGDLIIARNPYLKKKAVELPYELIQALESPFGGIRESAVTELGKYLHSRDLEMAALAVSYLEKMKMDDSRRISSLAEKLLAEFEQARTPSPKPTVPEPLPDMEPEVVNKLEAVSALPAEGAVGIGVMVDPYSQSLVEKTNPQLDQASITGKITSDELFWPKWVGTAVLALGSSMLLYFYYFTTQNRSFDVLLLLFCLMAGLTGLAQWGLFRNRLGFWWIPVNMAVGLGLGKLPEHLNNSIGWDAVDLRILLAIWIAFNFVASLLLLRKTQQKSSILPTLQTSGLRQNIFFILLAAALITDSIAIFIQATEKYEWVNIFLILYGIAAILTALSVPLIKEIPRNFGFITIAIFFLFDGFNVLQIVSHSDYPLYYFTLNGIVGLAAGIFFSFQREIWKNFGFLMLSGSLVTNGLAGIRLYDESVIPLLAISAICAVPAAFFFLFRR